MAMRKVTRTLFQDDDDDDMVNSSLSRPENIMHHDKRSSELTAPNSPCCVSPPAGSSQHKRCREWVQPEEPQGDLRLLRADVGARLRCLQQRGSTWRPRGTFLFHGNQRTQTGSCKINNSTWRKKMLLFMILLLIKMVRGSLFSYCNSSVYCSSLWCFFSQTKCHMFHQNKTPN